MSRRIIPVTVIDPVVMADQDDTSPLPHVPDLEITRVALRFGTASIESRLDDELATPGVIDASIKAAKSGAQAIVVNCMDDPGVPAAREMVRIPVIGPAESSMHLALTLAHSFSIITTSDEDIPVVWELIERLQLDHRCASVRALGLPVLDLHDDVDATASAYLKAARSAVETDRAGALISGCTLLSSLTPQVRSALAEHCGAVPIIDPIHTALHQARTLVTLGLSHSGQAYPAPAPKALHWPDHEADFGPVLTMEVTS